MTSPPILITGATGWLGLHLVQALARGLPGCEDVYDPRLPPRLMCLVPPGQDATAVAAEGADVVRGDLRNGQDCRRFCRHAAGAVLFHCAGVTHPDRVKTFYDVHVVGSAHLISAACAAGVRRAVVLSSDTVCGANPAPGSPFDEDSPARPYGNHGRSMLLLEELVWEYAEDGGIEAVVVRRPDLYGPNRPGQASFFRTVQEGKAAVVGAGSNRRSLAYVDDFCQGLIRAAFVPQAAGATYWIADPTPYTTNEVIETVERVLEDDFGEKCVGTRVRLPAFVGELAGLADWGLQVFGFYHRQLHEVGGSNRTSVCSVDRACRELGYRPQVGLHEGMRRSVEAAYAAGLMRRTAKASDRPVSLRLPGTSSRRAA